MPRPALEPIGLQVARTAKVLSRRFDDVLDAAGGSLPAWLVLVSLKAGRHGQQRELARAVGIEGPTLTHHLNRMEAEGLLSRHRDPADRRAQRVELTEAGDDLFARLRTAAADFDRQLRAGISDQEVAALGEVLTRLRANADGAVEAGR